MREKRKEREERKKEKRKKEFVFPEKHLHDLIYLRNNCTAFSFCSLAECSLIEQFSDLC